MKKNKVVSLMLCAAVTAALAGCNGNVDLPGESISAETAATAPVTLPTETTIVTTTTEPPPPPDITVHMLAVGDNLVQTYVYKAAQAASADGVSYNFAPLYENIKPIVQAADVAVINQETLICGGDYEITGSDLNFNSPVELGQAMIDVGFDVFTMANNHMLDKHIDGLESCMDYWDDMMEKNPGVLALGAYRDEADQNRIRVQEVKGMKIAYLAYTEHINGYELPADTSVRVGRTSNTALMERQIKEAKQLADAVIVSGHWGTEDSHIVRDDVTELAHQWVEWGADVVLGTGPHTAQTMEYAERSDGSMGFIFYSLGNFISAQTDNFNMVGEMGGFDLVKDGVTGELRVLNVSCEPVITQYDSGQFANLRLYPYHLYTPELAASHGLPYAPFGTAKAFNMGVVDAIVENYIPLEFRKLTETFVPSEPQIPDSTMPAETTAPAFPETTAAATPAATSATVYGEVTAIDPFATYAQTTLTTVTMPTPAA